MSTARFLAITGLILAAAGARLLPHPPNFAPVAAMALFAGATLSRKWLAFLVPLMAMLLSDAILYQSHNLTQDMNGYLMMRAVVYGCFGMTVCLGFFLQSRRSALPIGGMTLISSVLFFVVTNFVVWAFYQGFSFPRTTAGLIDCYVVALPFFGNTILGDALFTVVLFGGFALLEHFLPALRESPVIEPKEYVTADR